MTKCIICEKRPAQTEAGYCLNCGGHIEAETKRKAIKPFRYVTYKGNVVAFFKNGGDSLIPRLVTRKPECLPKKITLDLNTYIHGFTREQVKKLKRVVLSMAKV